MLASFVICIETNVIPADGSSKTIWTPRKELHKQRAEEEQDESAQTVDTRTQWIGPSVERFFVLHMYGSRRADGRVSEASMGGTYSRSKDAKRGFRWINRA